MWGQVKANRKGMDSAFQVIIDGLLRLVRVSTVCTSYPTGFLSP